MENNISLYRFLLYVLLSIGLISASSSRLDIVTAKISNQLKNYHTTKDMKLIKQHLNKFQEKHYTYPPAHRFSIWYQKELKNHLPFTFPLDRWGEPFAYKTNKNRTSFTLISKGKDKKIKTNDDLIIRGFLKKT